jgi:hypothetical protein
MRWLRRYLTESTPKLQHFAETLQVSKARSSIRHGARLVIRDTRVVPFPYAHPARGHGHPSLH